MQIVHADQRNAALFVGHEQKLVARLNPEQFACPLGNDDLSLFADLDQTDEFPLRELHRHEDLSFL